MKKMEELKRMWTEQHHSHCNGEITLLREVLAWANNRNEHLNQDRTVNELIREYLESLFDPSSSCRRTAEAAVKLLSGAIESSHCPDMLRAYEMVGGESFSWDGLDSLFEQWEPLVDQANDILYS